MRGERQSKADEERVKALIRQAQQLDQQLKTMADAGKKQQSAAQKAAQAVYDERVRKALENMDIEQINKSKQGIRVSLLRDAGIHNVWQASKKSYKQLCDIDGIGEQSAAKIRDVVKQYVEHTKDTVRVRIRVEDHSRTDSELIRALYVLIHCKDLTKEASRLYKLHHQSVTEEAEAAGRISGGFSWFFSPQVRKQHALAAADALENRLKGPFGTSPIYAQYQQVQNAGPNACWSDFQRNAPAYYAALESLGLNWIGEDPSQNGLPAQLVKEVSAQPLDLKLLKATLRNYQTFGTKYIVHQEKCLLGDEMGLGKTIQAIAAIAALAAAGEHHFMVVCPASVMVNWCREIEKHSHLTATKVHGNDEEALLQWKRTGEVMVTTYESISRFKLGEKYRFGMIIADEAHYAKNPNTIRTKALLDLAAKTKRVLFMSGTPLENKVEEMCFLVSCLQPEVAKNLESIKYLSTAAEFREKLAPVYLRRTREDVLQELPDLIEKEQWCELSPQETAAYRSSVDSGNFMAMRQVSWQMPDYTASAKAVRLKELCHQAVEEGRKVIVFSYFLNTLKQAMSAIEDRCFGPITGAVTPQQRQKIIDDYSNTEGGAVLLSQVTAGGTGLNIQSASVIMFCEPQIKPSIEHQAISRAYRMGQVRDVLVCRLLATNTVDEQILKILQEKQNIFDHFADESAVGVESMKEKEKDWIARMVAEERQRLKIQPKDGKDDIPPTSEPLTVS